MFEPRCYKHNTTGAIEKVSTQERADALENHTDWKPFSYTFQDKSKVETIDNTFKSLEKQYTNRYPSKEIYTPQEAVVDMNVLGEPEYSFPFEPIEKEIERIELDMQEIEEEQEHLAKQYGEMANKRKAFLKMHNHMTDFLDTWGKL